MSDFKLPEWKLGSQEWNVKPPLDGQLTTAMDSTGGLAPIAWQTVWRILVTFRAPALYRGDELPHPQLAALPRRPALLDVDDAGNLLTWGKQQSEHCPHTPYYD